MKKMLNKILIVLFFVILFGIVNISNNIKAATVNYSPVTPNDTIVPYQHIETEMTESEIYEYEFNENWYVSKGAYRMDEPTNQYNSHSYAWYNQDYENNHYNISDNDVLKYIEDGSYKETSIANVGDIICFYRVRLFYSNAEKTKLTSIEPYLGHSGIITGITGAFDPEDLSTLKYVTMVSKWGRGGLYSHKGDNHPYYKSAVHNVVISVSDQLYFDGLDNECMDDALFYVKVYTPTIDKEINVDKNSNVEITLQPNSFATYKVNIYNTGVYDFTVTDTNISNPSLVDIKIFNLNMNLIYNEETKINSNSSYISTKLSKGTYYLKISFSNKNIESNLCINIERKVNANYDVNNGLSIDYYEDGSEYTINKGVKSANTITEGFTRFLYLKDNTPSHSRLDYIWESSNPDLAMVTTYGTVLALDASKGSTVKITAIYKYDTSIYFEQTFNILEEKSTAPIEINIEMQLSRGEQKVISLPANDVPYNLNQYYIWSLDNEELATVSMYGTINSKNTGVVNILGRYKYNQRVFINIKLTIVD